MKNFKKVLSLALALLMVVGCMVVAPVETKAADGTYTKVSTVKEITDGGNFVLCAEYNNKLFALGTTISGKINAVEVAVSNGTLTGESIPVWTIASSSNGLSISNGASYLAYNSSTNFTSADSTSSNKAEWTVSLGTDGGFRFTNVNSTGRGIAYQYDNSGSPSSRFGAYAVSNDPLTKGEDTGYLFGLTVYKYSGTVEKKENITLEANATPAEIVDAAYQACADGVKLNGTWTLEGVIVSVEDYCTGEDDYQNVEVTMQVTGVDASKKISCYRLTGDGFDQIDVGYKIKVTGELGYYGTKVQFVQGCTLVSYESGEIEPTLPSTATPQQIVDKAYELAETGETMIGEYTLSGVITAIDTAYSEQYGNITVTIDVDDADKSMMCYRLSGTGIENLEIGYSITVTGTFGSYNGNPQFAQGCTLVSYEEGTIESTVPSTATPQEIVDAAYAAMESGEPMIGEYTLTGVIKSIDTAYSEQYKNITVTMLVNGTDKTVQCYRLAGDDVANLAVGDTITVKGSFGSYNGVVQFNAGSTLVSFVDTGDYVLPVFVVLFAGCALVAVGFVGRRKMA